MLVGLQFSFLKWMDVFGRGWGLAIRLLFIILSVALVYIHTVSDHYKQ